MIPGETIGTPEKPYAPGASFTVLDDWTFSVGATDTDTWPDVAANFQNDLEEYQPDPGMVYVSAPATMTYTGQGIDQQRVAGFGVYYIPLGGEPRKIGTCGPYGIAIDPFYEPSVEKEPSEDAFFCAEIAQHLAAGGQWRLSMYTIDEDGSQHLIEVFYAIS